eukprot:11766672-Prorocentrum_lima.AAC.1
MLGGGGGGAVVGGQAVPSVSCAGSGWLGLCRMPGPWQWQCVLPRWRPCGGIGELPSGRTQDRGWKGATKGTTWLSQ